MINKVGYYLYMALAFLFVTKSLFFLSEGEFAMAVGFCGMGLAWAAHAELLELKRKLL